MTSRRKRTKHRRRLFPPALPAGTRPERPPAPANPPAKPSPRPAAAPPPSIDLTRLELHRRAFGLVPAARDHTTGHAILMPGPGGTERSACTCLRPACLHLRELRRAVDAYTKQLGRDPLGAFDASLWHQVAVALVEHEAAPREDVRVQEQEPAGALAFLSPRGDVLARASLAAPGAERLLERLALGHGQSSLRARLLKDLARFQEPQGTAYMNLRGFETIGQRRERSLWHRLAYHAFRELPSGTLLQVAVDPTNGQATLAASAPSAPPGAPPWLRLAVPRPALPRLLAELARAFPERTDLAPRSLPVRWVHHVEPLGEDRFAVRPFLEVGAGAGRPLRLPVDEVVVFHYGTVAWVPALQAFVELPGKGVPRGCEDVRERLPEVLDAIGRGYGEGSAEVEASLGPGRVFRAPDAIVLTPRGERWDWVAARYRFGGGSIELRDLLLARRRGQRYLGTREGWVDLESEELDVPRTGGGAGAAAPGEPEPAEPGVLNLSALALLRLQARTAGALRVEGSGPEHERLRALLELRPARPYAPPRGLRSKLRPYQELGVSWLRFLWENRLGGLLCDDMGLGKTHQALAFLLLLKEDGLELPSLVVAPTTVLSHWKDKLAAHAPELRAAVHQGAGRDLERILPGSDVVLTSYGVLRRDAELLGRHRFAALILDEIQNLKNRDTRAHEAARGLRKEVSLGLTGTPVENSLEDLKALFDLVLPGHLGSNLGFTRRYVSMAGTEAAGPRLAELRRLIRPFVLRRTKQAVLTELPDKIEDRRRCSLSDTQAALYREALRSRGTSLMEQLRDKRMPVPYVHVFALIDLLKQICDHPALALKQLERADEHSCGKWDLFLELLDETLGSGQKLVVFSHYLGMLELMARELERRGVEHVRLTGTSRNRGSLVKRFNEEEGCRVFLGSLLAGGTGIDLVGGSVVIHYDRWWNAAREDQATDRLHRIGQRRTVQVFKLVTEGTVEERIDALIERKRALLEAVVRPDDPDLKKALSREELMEILDTP